MGFNNAWMNNKRLMLIYLCYLFLARLTIARITYALIWLGRLVHTEAWVGLNIGGGLKVK